MRTLLDVMKQPDTSQTLSAKEWELLINQARASNLLGRVRYLLERDGKLSYIPARAKSHLDAHQIIAEQQARQTLLELKEIHQALSASVSPIVILKGSAYVALKLPCHLGRTFSDIDILVPKSCVQLAEHGLLFNGWQRSLVDDYDDMYYRKWMHEIPPLKHASRGTVVDIHHNILPPTNASVPDASKFNTQTIEVDNVGPVTLLDDFDLIVHSATHLFSESEYHNGLRDLSDLDLMFQHFIETTHHKHQSPEEFFNHLIQRSQALGLAHFVMLALLFCTSVLSTNLPGETKVHVDRYFKQTRLHVLRRFCFTQAFTPNHKSTKSWKKALALFLLYLRGHYLRMPLKLLIPHLFHKAFITPFAGMTDKPEKSSALK